VDRARAYSDGASVKFFPLLSADCIPINILTTDLEEACFNANLAIPQTKLETSSGRARVEQCWVDAARGRVGADRVPKVVLAADLVEIHLSRWWLD
jgi:hypothetical protein